MDEAVAWLESDEYVCRRGIYIGAIFNIKCDLCGQSYKPSDNHTEQVCNFQERVWETLGCAMKVEF